MSILKMDYNPAYTNTGPSKESQSKIMKQSDVYIKE